MIRELDFELEPKNGLPYAVRVVVDMEALAKLLGPRANKNKGKRASMGRAAVAVRVIDYADSPD